MQINFEVDNLGAMLAQAASDGKIVTKLNITDIVDGRPTNCFVIVEDAPPAQDPTYEELLEAYNVATGGGPT